MIPLGSKARDKITGFSGIVTACCSYITGCDQVLLQPYIGGDGKFNDSHWFDEQRLEVDESAGILVLDNGANTGFDRAAPKR